MKKLISCIMISFKCRVTATYFNMLRDLQCFHSLPCHLCFAVPGLISSLLDEHGPNDKAILWLCSIHGMEAWTELYRCTLHDKGHFQRKILFLQWI